MSTSPKSKPSLSEIRRRAANARWSKPGSREHASKLYTGRAVPWASKISESIQTLYTDPTYLAKKEKHKLSPLEKALRIRLKMYKYNAQKSEHIWALTDEQARGLFLSPCYFCGKVSELPRLNGIDRMDNLLGYEAGNTLPCCWVCNRAKGKMTVTEFLFWIRRVHEQQQHPVLPKDPSLFA